MVHGLMWLPLLAVFGWLAWAGWQEYQKVETYQRWAQQFPHAKYDLYAVLGQQEATLTWGNPTPQGPVNLTSFSLTEVQEIRLLVEGQPVSLESLPERGRQVALEFRLMKESAPIVIPFTEVALAAQWWVHLRKQLVPLDPGP